MVDPGRAGLLELMAWLSPAFPVGSFSYSHGLERAVHDGLLAGSGKLRDWIEALLTAGSGWNDAVLFAQAWRRGRAGEALDDIAELGVALAGSAERLLETASQGDAFVQAAALWGRRIDLPAQCPYCVAVGAHAGAAGIACEDALAAFLQAFASNLLQTAIRLGVLGQSGAVSKLAGLGPSILAIAARAASATPDDLGSATLVAEIAAMNHETQYSRLFRT